MVLSDNCWLDIHSSVPHWRDYCSAILFFSSFGKLSSKIVVGGSDDDGAAGVVAHTQFQESAGEAIKEEHSEWLRLHFLKGELPRYNCRRDQASYQLTSLVLLLCCLNLFAVRILGSRWGLWFVVSSLLVIWRLEAPTHNGTWGGLSSHDLENQMHPYFNVPYFASRSVLVLVFK